MKRACGLSILVGAALALTLGSAAAASDDQIDICHFPPGNPENVQVIRVGEKAAVTHVEKHSDWPVLAFNVNGVGCAFCAEASDECAVFCVGPPVCLCPPDEVEECCELNPCCDNCPEPRPEECSVISCGSDPPDCSLTVCSAPPGDDD